MPNFTGTKFDYTTELINSIPEEIKNRSYMWRGIRVELNTLLEPGNHGKTLRITLNNDGEDINKRSIESIRGAVYNWTRAVDLHKKGFAAHTITDTREIPYKVYIFLERLPTD